MVTVGARCSSAMGFCGDPGLILDKNLDLKMLLRLWTGDWLSFVVVAVVVVVCCDNDDVDVDISDVTDIIDAVFELRLSSS